MRQPWETAVSATRFNSSLSANVESSTLARARAAVAGLRGTEHAIEGGMSGLVNEGLLQVVEQLEATHNNGEPFPDVDRLRRGRAL